MRFDPNLKLKCNVLIDSYLQHKAMNNDIELARKEEQLINLLYPYVITNVIPAEISRSRIKETLYEDLCQCAKLGIVEAIRSYNPEKGLITTWVIWHARNRTCRDKTETTVTVPNHIKEICRTLQKIINSLRKKDVSFITFDSLYGEIDEKLRITPSMFKNTMQFLSYSNTITWTDSSSGISLDELQNNIHTKIASKNNVSMDTVLEKSEYRILKSDLYSELEKSVELKVIFEKALSQLTSEEQLIINLLSEGFTIRQLYYKGFNKQYVTKVIEKLQTILENEEKDPS